MEKPIEAHPITLTPKAILMAKEALSENNGTEGNYLRVSIRGGGCSGFQYGLSFSENTDEHDLVSNHDGLQVVTDIFTAIQIPGTVIDYEETLNGSGFKFNNPEAKRTCGCGSSFN